MIDTVVKESPCVFKEVVSISRMGMRTMRLQISKTACNKNLEIIIRPVSFEFMITSNIPPFFYKNAAG